MFYIKVCQRLDSNRRPLVSKATTEAQPLTNVRKLATKNKFIRRHNLDM